MKKIITLLAMVCLFALGAQTAFAADKTTVVDAEKFVQTNSLSIGLPLYSPKSDQGEPTSDDFVQIMGKASAVVKNHKIYTYRELGQAINKDHQVNIFTLERKQATKVFKDYVDKYTDGYVVCTVANDLNVVFFFDVYKSGTNELLYTYEVTMGRHFGRGSECFMEASKAFFTAYEKDLKSQATKLEKDKEKAAKDKEKADKKKG